MKTQTAVEWYYEQTVIQGNTNYYELLEQAKELEKQQIIDAVDKTRNKLVIGEEFNAPWYDDELLSNGERYYKYIYGGQGTDDTTSLGSSEKV